MRQPLAVSLLKHRPGMHRTLRGEAGFTLVEMLLVTAIVAIIAGMAAPRLMDVSDSIKLGNSTRAVERELQKARLTAVQANQPMRLRFNCPSSGNYRITELVGTPSVPAAADDAANRCALANYPYPADTDKNPLTRPNKDGPLQYLDPKVSFSQAATIEFWPDGSAHMASTGTTTNPWPIISGTGYSVILAKGTQTKTILVNGVGKIQIQ